MLVVVVVVVVAAAAVAIVDFATPQVLYHVVSPELQVAVCFHNQYHHHNSVELRICKKKKKKKCVGDSIRVKHSNTYGTSV